MDLESITREVTVRGTSQGMDDVARAYDKVADSADKAAVASDKQSKVSESAQRALDKLKRQLDDNYKASTQLQQGEDTLARAREQGLVGAQEQARLSDLLVNKYGVASGASKIFAEATSGVRGQLIALSAGAGPVGTFLAAIPGWGLAAAAALGILAAAWTFVGQESARMGEKAVELRAFTIATDLTVTQFGALKQGAADLGIAGDTVAQRFERLTAGLNEARRGAGQLYEDVRTVSASLADELQHSTTTAQGINVLAKAYQAAADQSAKLALSQAIFGGRGGAQFGPILGSIADAGGIEKLAAATKGWSEATDAQAQRWATLKTQLDDTEKRTKNILAAIFTEEGLKAALAAAQYMERTAKATAELARQRDGLTWYQKLLTDLAKSSAEEHGIDPGVIDEITAVFAARQRLQDAVKSKGFGIDKADLESWGQLSDKLRGILTPAEQAAASLKQLQDDAANTASKWSLFVAFLGTGATISERTQARIAALNSTLLDHKTGLTDDALAAAAYSRALAAINLDAAIQRTAALTGILGISATVQDQYRARLQQIAKALQEGAPATETQIANAKRLAMAQADGTFQLQAQIDTSKVQASTIGLTVAKAEEFRLIQTKINENLNAGRPAFDGVTDAYRKLAAAAGEAKSAEELKNAADQAQFDLTTALLDATGKRIAQLQKQYGTNADTDAIASTLQLTDALKQAQSAGTQFTTTLVDGLLDGKNFVDTLKSAFDGLAKTMANAAIKDLFSGNFEKAGIEAVIAVGAKLASNFFDTSQEKELQKAKDAWTGMTEKLQQFELTAKGFDLSGPASSIRSLYDTAVELAKAANAAHDMPGLMRVVTSFVAGMNRIVNDFANPAIGLSDSATQIKTLQDEAAGLVQTLQDIGQSSQSSADAIQNGLLKQIKAIQDALAKSLQSDINDAKGLGFVNQVNDLVAKEQQLFAENNAPAQLISDWFTNMVQQVVDGLNDDQFKSFLSVFPQLTASVHESTDALKAQADAQKQLQDQIDQTARGIVDYVNNFRGGSNSLLTPQAQLSAAQATYNAQYALAASNNAAAQQTITQYADAYINALKANFGVGGASQINGVLDQLLGLPAVQQTTDPVVLALRDVLTAVNTVGTNTGASGVLKAAIDSGSAVATAVALQNYFDTLDTNVNGLIDFNEMKSALGGMASDSALRDMFTRLDTDNSGNLSQAELTAARTGTVATNTDTTVSRLNDTINNLNTVVDRLNSGNSLLSAIQGLQGTATSQLTLLKDNLTTGQTINFNAVDQFGHQVSVSTAGNVLEALRKIVANTYAISVNTSGATSIKLIGTYASGGWITGGITGRDSVPIMAMPDEFMVRTDATRALTSQFGAGVMDMINAGRLPANIVPFPVPFANDNSGLAAAIKALHEDLVKVLKALGDDVREAGAIGATHVGEKVDRVAKHLENVTREHALDRQAA